MRPFDYIAAQTVGETCSLLAAYGSDARILAGGTDLLIEQRRADATRAKILIDISFLRELRLITVFDGVVIIKPLTTHSDLVKSTDVRNCAPFLSAAAGAVGSPQIRNRGTIGGNIMNAAACADIVPPLIALGATISLASTRGSRELSLEHLFLEPYRTKAQPDELLTEIRFQRFAPAMRSAFIKLGRRNALSISRLSVASAVQQDNRGNIIDARIVPGATFPTWERVVDAERMLIGERPSEKLFAAVGQRVSQLMIQHAGRRWSTEYKEQVIAVLVRRSLEQCVSTNGISKM